MVFSFDSNVEFKGFYKFDEATISNSFSNVVCFYNRANKLRFDLRRRERIEGRTFKTIPHEIETQTATKQAPR